MKIAILVGGLPPLYNGGTEIATVQIAKYAAKAGHDVHVIAADGSGKGKSGYKALQQQGFKVHWIETMHSRYLHGLVYIPQAVVVTLALRPDVIHSQAMYMAPTALIASRLGGIPYIFYERGGIRQKSVFNKPLYKMFMFTAKRVIAQTENQKQALLTFHKRDIEVIPNGIEVERFGNLSKVEARHKLGLSDKKIILSVGRARPEKNLACFIRAAKLQPNYQYILVGDGPRLSSLEIMAPPNVLFTGTVQNELIPTYMAAADVLVNTSHFEGFPNVFLEAFASGLPVVAPNVTGIPEIVKDGVNGILTKPDDEHSTCEAINNIVLDDCLTSYMSAANKQKAKEYTWENVVRRLYG